MHDDLAKTSAFFLAHPCLHHRPYELYENVPFRCFFRSISWRMYEVEWIDEEAVVTTDFKFRIGCTTFRVRTTSGLVHAPADNSVTSLSS